MTPAVAIVADAGPGAGLGHVSRAGALAVALRARGMEVVCFVQHGGALERDGIAWRPLGDGEGGEIGEGGGGGREIGGGGGGEGGGGGGIAAASTVVVDSYRLDHDDSRRLAGARPLVLFHDGDGGGDDARVPGAALVVSLAGDGPGILSGPRYACLRPAYWGVPAREPSPAVRSVLVATGAGAASGGAVLAAAARDALPDAVVRLVVGPYEQEPPPAGVDVLRAPASLASALRGADLVVTAAGQTMLEALCVGTPTVAVAVVANQRAQLERLAAERAVRAADADHVADVVAALARAPEERATLGRRGQALVDGYGALRVAWHVAAL